LEKGEGHFLLNRYMSHKTPKLIKPMKYVISISFIILLVIASVFLIGCRNTNSSSNSQEISGVIAESGSTTVQPLAERLADSFMDKNPHVNVIIQGGGSSVGIKAAYEGIVDIGASSRELTPDDPPVEKFLLAKDGIAVIVNPANPIDNLSIEQVRNVFSGNISNWNEVGGADHEIHLVAREEGSGTRTAFHDMVMTDEDGSEDRVSRRAILQSSNGSIIQVVRSDPNAAGFISFGYLTEIVKAISINGSAPAKENAKNGDYPIVRPLYFVTGNQPVGIVKTFIDYCFEEEAQEIVADEGYISVK
jgi:phosphate transport system substrate-binding protein